MFLKNINAHNVLILVIIIFSIFS